MAQASAVLTYDAVGNREDLTNVIATITLSETPIFSSLEKVAAKGTLHEWQTDTLSTGAVNHAIEGAEFSYAYPAYRARVHNHTQIFTKEVEVSGTQEAVAVAGLDDEFAYQMEKRMKEIATDIELALITGTGNSGASGTARDINGILSFITTNVETGTGTSTTETLTESMYNNALQTIWAAGGRPDTTYVNGFQKRKISGFASNSQRFQQVDNEGELKNSIAVYDSDFGRQKIVLDSFMTSTVVALLQTDMWKVAQLRPIKVVDVAVTGDAKRGALVGELTLEARNEASSGKITGLATS
jgi:hypothetical protein